MPWGLEAFDRAAREDKLVLLDSGATWCHWCHVMEHVTYDDPDVAGLINSQFVAVRIDRDRQPDVDARFQRASALTGSGAGGWPLTAVITPEGHLLFKGTFLPPRADQQYGASAGLLDILKQLDVYWRRHREDVARAAGQLTAQVLEHERQAFDSQGELSMELVERVAGGIKKQSDTEHGGFGNAPKFYAATAIRLMLNRAWDGDRQARQIVDKALVAIARGGVFDQIGGGFHRYSVDARWHVPHFEKMAYDNAPMLANYCDAYRLLGREEFATVARRTIAWVNDTLRGRGAFFASQDADTQPNDDGDYFTWTVHEFEQAAGPDAPALIALYGADEAGHMPGRVGRNVLHLARAPEQVASLLKIEPESVGQAIERGNASLAAARERRVAPKVDQTLFADLNGMMIDAFLTAHERLGDALPRAAALEALADVLLKLRLEDGSFAHYLDDGKLTGWGLLPDQAWMLRALVHAYAVEPDDRYLQNARELGDYILDNLVGDTRAFVSARPGDPLEGGELIVWDDSPTQSPPSVTAEALVQLGHLTDDGRYAEAAGAALRSFAGGVNEEWGTFLAGYALAVDQYIGAPSVTVIGSRDEQSAQVLAQTARTAAVPGTLVIVLDPVRPAHVSALGRLGLPPKPTTIAYVCRRGTCLEPATTPEELEKTIRSRQ